jgi:hypothetical protein
MQSVNILIDILIDILVDALSRRFLVGMRQTILRVQSTLAFGAVGPSSQLRLPQVFRHLTHDVVQLTIAKECVVDSNTDPDLLERYRRPSPR